MSRCLAAIVSLALIVGACGDDDADDPAGVLDGFVEAYNDGDLEGLMAFFTEESVVTGHPFSSRSTGLAELRTLHRDDIAAAATEDAYVISNVSVSGDTVTWDHVWTSDTGDEFCQQGHEAVIADGKIVAWAWPSGEIDCP